MSVGFGGAGSKLASLLDPEQSTVFDVSAVELNKIDASTKIRAVVHSSRDQMKGSRKDPAIGREAFQSVRQKLLSLIRGDVVFSSTGGGTGNGLCSALLDYLSNVDGVGIIDKTLFVFVLPCAEREVSDYIDNTIDFLDRFIAPAIDAGNTGNIVLFSNQHKFEKRIPEQKYNQMIIDSLRQFLLIPQKNEDFNQLDGNIDYEDFVLYKSKPYFNHFCQFKYDPETPFGSQLQSHYNPLLLKPEGSIEALFLLELPDPELTHKFYNIIDFFSEQNVTPTYSVLENPNLKKPLITVSLLYSRKPLELVETYNSIANDHKRNKIKKSLEQYVTLSKLEVDLQSEAQRVFEEIGKDGEEILNVLKRIGKL